jgi:hypothetical protein
MMAGREMEKGKKEGRKEGGTAERKAVRKRGQ